ncbi:metal ABC transporter ATP-binding protein [Arthrobacter agilis]|uniref:metal ABC transporter ATP-binding protein n=1 Tax=Arthrobacter agilis TaxID=37921 RepID=UPI000B34ECC9|nr:metal ABC transporter ATP-binding protein [Arthrobacter agilis]OUM44040.1 ABC transporter [Arthrobacter agilis]PPB46418.1 metal ABC transporter ATP-binding protein [Arthrobacter agilis]TPV23927.1 metal ABC transporter ATP-binding protein [Arthrobacter agilis]VDR32674.1 Iron(3+)-hydroxamate import ATP-binding protein FhuC [Arthrobacter agilis]
MTTHPPQVPPRDPAARDAHPSGPPVLDVRHLGVRYDDVRALDDVTVSLRAGSICGLIGVNGSGKSTLFKALMGLVVPQEGRVELFGDTTASARRAGLVAYMPQAEEVDWTFPVSVSDVVAMGVYGRLGAARRLRPADRAAVADSLDRVGLADLARRQIGQLSGGQRKRVFIARSIAQDARLLLLDEPFAGVDRSSERTMTALLTALRDEGRSVLVSTHDLAGVPAFCDEAVLLHRRVLAQGDPAAVLTQGNLARAFGAAPPDAVPAVPTAARIGDS